MNIYELSKLCDMNDMIEIIDYDSKERLFYGFNKNILCHKKYFVEYMYLYNNTLVIYVKNMNKINN